MLIRRFQLIPWHLSYQDVSVRVSGAAALLFIDLKIATPPPAPVTATSTTVGW